MTEAKRSTAWKNLERQVAKDFGGKRSGAKGSAVPDVEDAIGDLQIECKYQGRLSLRKAHLAQAKRNAKGDPWAIVLREHNQSTKYVVLDYDYFHMLYLHYHADSS